MAEPVIVKHNMDITVNGNRFTVSHVKKGADDCIKLCVQGKSVSFQTFMTALEEHNIIIMYPVRDEIEADYNQTAEVILKTSLPC